MFWKSSPEQCAGFPAPDSGPTAWRTEIPGFSITAAWFAPADPVFLNAALETVTVGLRRRCGNRVSSRIASLSAPPARGALSCQGRVAHPAPRHDEPLTP
jgi:hypothetical protein